tara:strand:+ start:84 stop:299 length:216 start_codon:yes stop_codon:yes gene_type:complete
MSKKDSIALRLQKRGFSGGKIKWVPNNIHGKSPTLRGWLLKLEDDSEWQVLGTNYEDAIKKIDSLQIKQNI